jgi:diguanylate cyclase (GGDEF)-like protein
VPAHEQEPWRRLHGHRRLQGRNDKYGHSIGDRLLASVSGVVRRELRQMDILTRYAGDEFVAIMPMASGKMAVSISERMRNAVEDQLFSVRNDTMSVWA